jgi:Arylmalonate decarboxylase
LTRSSTHRPVPPLRSASTPKRLSSRGSLHGSGFPSWRRAHRPCWLCAPSGVERVALVHPPWFDAELNDLGAAYFESTGFDVVSSGSAALSQDPRRIDAAAVYEWTSRNVSGAAEAVFIGGNGFRAAGATGALEVEPGRPVLTANQVLLWHLLAETGATCEVGGYGRLFMHEPRPTPQQRRAATAPRSHSDRFRPAAEGADCRGRVAPGPSRASGRRGPRLHASPSGCR